MKQRSVKMEPDWSNIDATKSWLESRYPDSNNQTGSPLYRYLKDELAKGSVAREEQISSTVR